MSEDVLAEWAEAQRRPMSIEQRETVETVYELLRAFDPTRMESARQKLAPMLRLV